MRLMHRISLFLSLATLLCALPGCTMAARSPEPQQLSSSLQLRASQRVSPATPKPTPKPTPTPLPTSTPIPFAKYAPTVNMSFAELVGDDGIYDLPAGYPAEDTYQIIVDLAHQVTMVYEKDATGAYTVPVRYMLCSTGANDCTPKGEFRMGAYRVRFSRFSRDGRYGQYWTQIRKAIYFHTILYTKKNAASYQDFIFDRLGQMDSHGCVRLTVPDARWMWYHIAAGTSCIIRDGSKDDTATAAIREQLVLACPPAQQLQLKAGEIPNTDNWKIADIPHEVSFQQGSQN